MFRWLSRSSRARERTDARWYHLEIRGQSQSERFRECLAVVQSRVGVGTCDVPWANADDWPAQVLAAAKVLKNDYVSPGFRDE